MKKNTSWWLVLLLLFSTSLFAQDKGVHFEHGLTWAQVQAKAKAEHKYIFIDCFTSWCGPCKMMDTLVYPLQEVGDSVNAKFISIRMQMDRTIKDSPDTKLLYNDAVEINKEYHIVAYPTFLFFNSDGHIVHRATGGRLPATEFIKTAAEARDPSTQYYTLLGNFNKNPGSNPAEIRKLADMAYYNHDQKVLSTFVTAYVSTQRNIYTKGNLDFLYKYTLSSKDSSFKVFLFHGNKVDAILGKGKSAGKILEIAYEEDYHDSAVPGESPNWKTTEAILESNYPGYGKELTSWFQIEYYLYSAKDWNKLAPAMNHYMAKYKSDIVLRFVDGISQGIFEECTDKSCLDVALAWSKLAKDLGNPTSNITYANLLYKTGNTPEAIRLMTAMLNRGGIGSNMFVDLIDKMNKGEKTWTNP